LPGAIEIIRNENSGRLARARSLVGRTDDAVATMQRSIEAADAAKQILDARRREAALTEIYAEAGLARECVTLLAKLLRVPSGLTVPMLKVDPIWDNVREDAAFKALLADPKNSAPL